MTEALAALLPAGLAFLMFSVGLRLSLQDLAAPLRAPRALLLGLAVQITLLPLAAYAFATLFRLPPEMAAGLMLVAAAPGGVTSNYICVLVRADLALSAAMTLCTTLLCSLTIPAVLLLAGTGISLEPGTLVRISTGMAATAILPLLAGLCLKALAHGWAGRMRRGVDPLARLVFLAIVAATLARNWAGIEEHILQVGPACVALNLFAIAAAAAAGRFAGLSGRQSRAIAVEASLQNVAVTIFLASSVLMSPALAIPGLVYVFAMNLSALAHIALVSFQARRSGAAA